MNSSIFRLIYTPALFSFSIALDVFPVWMEKYVSEMRIEPEKYRFEAGEINRLCRNLVIENVK
jgi:hypothetical protein